MESHILDYKIIGDDIQLVEVELDPFETVIAEAGSMVYMESGIEFDVKMGDGSSPNQSFVNKLFSAGARILTGESLFLTHFTNKGRGKQKVAFAAPYPGTIIPINLSEKGGKLIVQKDGFLCAAFGTKLSIMLNRKIGAGLVGGEGLFLATIRGTGRVWLQSMPIRKLIQAISPYGKNIRKEGSSLLGGLLER